MLLKCQTKYAWILEPNVVPGTRFLELLLHTIQISEYSSSLLGYQGEIFSVESLSHESHHPFTFPSGMIKDKLISQFHWGRYHQNGQEQMKDMILYPDRRYEPIAERILEVDSLHKMWFLDVHLVLPLFLQEKQSLPVSLSQILPVEDMILSFALKYYANKKSYVLPSLYSDEKTWGDTSSQPPIVLPFKDLNTFSINIESDRQYLLNHYLSRGGKFILTKESHQSTPTPLSILLFFDPHQISLSTFIALVSGISKHLSNDWFGKIFLKSAHHQFIFLCLYLRILSF